MSLEQQPTPRGRRRLVSFIADIECRRQQADISWS
jgi:hypothetical protein